MLLKDIIKEVVDIVTLPVKEVAKRVKEAGAEVADKIRETVETAFAKGFEFFFPEFLERLKVEICLLYTSPSPRDLSTSRMPSSA